MDVRKIGDTLVSHCNAGTERDALETLYADDALSIEAAANPVTGTAITEGKTGIRGKHDWWDNAMDTHMSKADGPYPHGDDRFAVIFEADATDKESGQRFQMKEIGVYTVAQGKIIKEEFFYTM